MACSVVPKCARKELLADQVAIYKHRNGKKPYILAEIFGSEQESGGTRAGVDFLRGGD